MVLLKRLSYDELAKINCLVTRNHYTHLAENCGCAYLYPKDQYSKGLLAMEILMWIYTVAYMALVGYEFYLQRWTLFVASLKLNPSKVLLILSFILTLLLIPLRLGCSADGEDYLTIVSIIFKSSYVLYLGRGFKRITTFVYIIHQVMKTQFSRFMLILSIFIMGFSQAFYVGCEFGIPEGGYDWTNKGEQLFTSPFESMYLINIFLMNDIGNAYVYMHQSYYQTIILILYLICIILHGILLINLLIAMMSNTYETTTKLDREWLRQVSKF